MKLRSVFFEKHLRELAVYTTLYITLYITLIVFLMLQNIAYHW